VSERSAACGCCRTNGEGLEREARQHKATPEEAALAAAKDASAGHTHDVGEL